MRTRRNLWTSVTAALVVLLSACTSTVAGTATTNGTATSPGADRLAEALALVPAVAGSAEVSDLATSKQRWGLSGVTSETGANSAEAKQFSSKLMATGLGSNLLIYTPMLEGVAWNGLDVDTEIRPQVDGPPVTIYRLRSSLDMQKVIDSLQADGMTRTGSDEAPFFVPKSLGDGKFGQLFLSGVTVYPALHLLVSGPQDSWAMPAPGASLAGVAGVADLVADLPPADYVAIDSGPRACTDPAQALGGRGTPQAVQQFLGALDAAGDRQAVSGAVVAVTGDEAGQIRVGYADAAAATADLPVRTAILQTVDSPVSRQPYTQLFTARSTIVGSTLRYAVTEERPSILIRTRQQRDTPWAFC
ncbi:hypothetical protein ABLG96_03965 [Nakamurella sp. A5-74]|uniref:Lipoprotein n=1 Tax=Nakamurella sp. A5-74 TaxID=3158264 RepID=A0AAU8DR64_9ACTN